MKNNIIVEIQKVIKKLLTFFESSGRINEIIQSFIVKTENFTKQTG